MKVEMYIILLVFLVLCGGCIYLREGEIHRKNHKFLKWAFIAIFLIYSLRASTVGRDLPGYMRAYDTAIGDSFSSLSFGNFERGYLFIMWICNKLNLSWQMFLTICSFIILFPIFLFIKKYSRNAFLSVIIYVCYIFFEFNLTGIRQALATSIVLIAIIVLLESKRFGIIKYCILTLLATTFHSSAYIGFFYVPFHFMRNYKTYTASILALCVVFFFGRGYIMAFVKNFFEKDSMRADASLYIGLNMLFLFCLAVLFIFSSYNREKCQKTYSRRMADIMAVSGQSIAEISEKMFYLSIATLFLFGSDTSVRSYMLLNQVIIVLLPNSMGYVFDKKSKNIAEFVLVGFFVIFMFTNTLIPNNFDIVPYKFFWE